MTKEEYRLARNAWVLKQYDLEPKKPHNIVEHWAWYIKKEREFRQLLAGKGIKIDNK